jgi:subfamily B ATP-binding cassette protein MsbA
MTILSTVLVLVWIDWQLTLFVMFFLPICILPMIVLGRKVRRATRENRRQAAAQSSLLIESLAAVRVVKAYSLEKEQSSKFADFSRQLLRQSMKSVRAKELINPFIETIGAIGVGILIVYILATGKSGADLAIFLGAVMTVYTPVKNLGKLHVMFQEARVGVDRMMAILREQPTVVEPPRPKPMKPFSREIRFENITFGYGDRLIFRNFNLTVPRGMKLGVAGESGSGKSTLINLLLRFYDPLEGRIMIDGEDIREFSTDELRSQIALVSQEIVLFDQTVAENIALGKRGASRAEIEAAGRAANAEEFIARLPNGYNTRVGERGVLLSGGQRQRIAIARAFIRQAPILALDEATAALDTESEAQVQRAIDRLAENRTVLCVAHRLSTLAKMDEAMVLSGGAVIARGSPAKVLRLGAAASEVTDFLAAK